VYNFAADQALYCFQNLTRKTPRLLNPFRQQGEARAAIINGKKELGKGYKGQKGFGGHIQLISVGQRKVNGEFTGDRGSIYG
jgi:hypothetical protein